MSLGRAACIRFYKMTREELGSCAASGEQDEADMSVVLQPGSLFCFTGALYSDYKHEIPEVEDDAVPRSCINAAAAGVSIGDAISCSGCRYSVTLRSVACIAVQADAGELPMHLEERQRRRVWWLSSINEKK